MGGAVRALGWIGAAVASGSVGLVALSQLLGSYEEAIEIAKAEEDRVLAVVAARDLYQGVQIVEEDLYAVQIPARYLPEGVFLTPEYVVGRIPRERILANEFIRSGRLSDPENGQGLNAMIPRGMRAISLEIGDGEALQGLLHPGSYVDVLTTMEGRSGEAETRTLLQGMFVLGVDSRLRDETREQARELRGRGKPTVTLLASAEQTEVLAHADQLADVRLSLRSDGDVGTMAVTGSTTLDDLFGRQPPVRATPAPAPAAPKVFCEPVEVILGEQKVIQYFREDMTECEPRVPQGGGSR